MERSTRIAQILLDIQAVNFFPENPIRFKSGLLSPVYVDNRRFPYFPPSWTVVIEGFAQLLQEKALEEVNVIAGIETAGIPHSAALSYTLQKPSVFIRKATKEHGTKKMVEGGEVQGQGVLLVEDHISTGMSSIHGVDVLKAEAALVRACFSISTYGWKVAEQAFAEAAVPQFSLTSFPEILAEAEGKKILTPTQAREVHEWSENPQGWSAAHQTR